MEELVEPDNQKTILESVAEMAEFCNSIASLVVGHRKILVDGSFDVNLADSMAAALHSHLLGLVHHWQAEDEMDVHVLEFLVGDEDEEDE